MPGKHLALADKPWLGFKHAQWLLWSPDWSIVRTIAGIAVKFCAAVHLSQPLRGPIRFHANLYNTRPVLYSYIEHWIFSVIIVICNIHQWNENWATRINWDSNRNKDEFQWCNTADWMFPTHPLYFTPNCSTCRLFLPPSTRDRQLLSCKFPLTNSTPQRVWQSDALPSPVRYVWPNPLNLAPLTLRCSSWPS